VEAKPRKVEVYQRPGGAQPFLDWMRQQDKAAISEIIARINKVRRGVLGDYREVGEGILELRFIGPGPGYRIYCADDGRSLVLLLCGGIKRSQTADIHYAKNLWSEYKEGKSKKGREAQHRSVRRGTKK
jgi:putative addiction module killer protein